MYLSCVIVLSLFVRGAGGGGALARGGCLGAVFSWWWCSGPWALIFGGGCGGGPWALICGGGGGGDGGL